MTLNPDPLYVGEDSTWSCRPLTPRESEVMRLMATGMTRKVAAAELSISEDTIRWHLERTYRKLDAGSLVGAMCALGWVHVEREPVRHTPLLAAVIAAMPVAVVCIFILERARDVLRAIVGRNS